MGGDQSGVGDCDSSKSTSSRTTAAGPACHCVPQWYVLHRSSIAPIGIELAIHVLYNVYRLFLIKSLERERRERELINFML